MAILIVAVALVVGATARAGGAAPAYRIVSTTRGEGQAGLVQNVVRMPTEHFFRRIVWEELPARLFVPQADFSVLASADATGALNESALIEGAGVPPVPVRMAFAAAQSVLLVRGGALLTAFSLRGRLDGGEGEAAVRELEEAGLRAIDIEGEGMALVDAATREPLAGRLRILRRLTPSPWRTDAPRGAKESSVETAWAALP